MSYFTNLDSIITNFLSSLLPHNHFFENFFSFFSLKGSSILVWILVIGIVVLLEERKHPGIGKRDKQFLLVFSLSFLLTAFLSDIVLKNIFMRPRPYLSSIINHLSSFRCPTDFSFPSSHATTAFASATILAFFDKKRKLFYYLVALLISYSRIYLGCHYFFDVAAGGVMGYLLSVILTYIPRRLS